MSYFSKKAVVYGAGKSGLAAYGLLKEKGARAVIFDDDPSKERATDMKGVFEDADVVVLSPGVPIDAPLVLDAKRRGVRVIGELELAFEFCVAKQIAVTGTNGKTSTVTLIDEILKSAGVSSHAVGNVGTPFSSIADRLYDSEVAVIEASSFQLESCEKFSPDVAVLLNVAPDHLTRHADMRAYEQAKAKIFSAQTEADFAIYNADDFRAARLAEESAAKKIPFSMKRPVKGGAYISSGFIVYDGAVVISLDDVEMRGREIENALAATAVAMNEGIGAYTVARALAKFRRPSYRRQLLGELGGVKFFNDSKATNISSSISAVEATEGEVVLILGGADMKEDFAELFENSGEKVKWAVAVGDNAYAIESAASAVGFENVRVVKTLEEAAKTAYELAKDSGAGSVLFSPASKSFDRYSDYAQRGRDFDGICAAMGVR